jgi:nitroreductase
MINKKDLLEAFAFRHACKVFDENKKISTEDFDTILETGRLSPTSFGLEPFEMLVVQDPVLREKLKTYTWGAQKQLPTASHFVLYLAKKSPLMHFDSPQLEDFMRKVQLLSDETIAMRKNLLKNFQEKDFTINTPEKLEDWAGKQIYIALGNMMSAAAMLGIDSCPVEGFQKEEINKILAQDFNIDTEKYGVCVMCAFGYRLAPPMREKTRRNMEEIVKWY